MKPPFRSDFLVLAILAVFLVLVALVHFVWAPPIVSHDSAFGLEVWQSMEGGAGWNEISTPRPNNIALSQHAFVAWWSPGQYLPAGLLMRTGLSLGAAILLTSFLGSCSLALGLWRLCLALGESRIAASIAAAVGATTWHTLYSFGFFIGGEVALAAIWPWVILYAWQTRQRRWLQLAILPLLFVAGSFAKLSFEIYALALVAYLWLQEVCEHRWQIPAVLNAAAGFAVALLAYVAIWHFVFTGRGPTPASSLSAPVSLGVAAAFALNAPWSSAVGFGSLVGRLLPTESGSPIEGSIVLRITMLLVAPVAMSAYALLIPSKRPLFGLAGTISLIAAILLGTLLMWGASVSLEDRHLRPAGLLLLAVGASIAVDRRSRAWPLAASLLVLSILFGAGATAQRIFKIKKYGVRSVRGVSMLDIDEPALRFLEGLDKQGALICLPRVTFAPALQHARILILNNAEIPAQTEWRGRVPSLILAIPQEAGSDKYAARWRASFVQYQESEWRVVKMGNWEFWQAGNLKSASSS